MCHQCICMDNYVVKINSNIEHLHEERLNDKEHQKVHRHINPFVSRLVYINLVAVETIIDTNAHPPNLL